jgi:hypothetical protein
LSNVKEYNPRVPESFPSYSPINNNNIPDHNISDVPRTIGKSTEYDNRESHLRQDNNVSNYSELQRGFIDATDSLIKFIKEIIKPVVTINNQSKEVPVMYVNAEKWVSTQLYGYMKDESGKTLAPAISVRRTNIDNNVINKLHGVRSYGNEFTFYSKYSQLNKYDNFSILHNQIPKKEIYSIAVPDWYKVEYEIILWTEYISQMDKLIEDFMYFRGTPIGGLNGLKYKGDILSVSAPETSNGSGEDRLVKSTINFEMFVPIISSKETNLKKEITIGKIMFNEDRSM